MTASYAIPVHACDADHLHSPARQHMTQRLAHELRPTKVMNGGPAEQQDNVSTTHSHNHSSHISNNHIEIEDEHLDSTPQLPASKIASMKASNSRPKSMRRRISVGLPTHMDASHHTAISAVSAASKPVHTDGHSRLTRTLLQTFQHRPLLHSILVEKDSRRIFYFMW